MHKINLKNNNSSVPNANYNNNCNNNYQNNDSSASCNVSDFDSYYK